MIAGCNKGLGKRGEERPTIVVDRARLSMHENRGRNDPPPEALGDHLVPETDAKNRQSVLGATHQVEADSRVGGNPRPRRDHRGTKAALENLVEEEKQNLYRVTEMSKGEAEKVLMARIEADLEHEKDVMVSRMVERAKEKAEDRARDILATAIQRMSAQHCQIAMKISACASFPTEPSGPGGPER